MSYSSINQKGMQDYVDILEWHTFIWSAKNLLKISIYVFFFTCMSLFLSKPLECKFLINKLIWLSLLTYLFYEKIQDSSINSTKFGNWSH
jgi:hypothetical protein